MHRRRDTILLTQKGNDAHAQPPELGTIANSMTERKAAITDIFARYADRLTGFVLQVHPPEVSIVLMRIAGIYGS